MIAIFKDDDNGYLNWINTNPTGFIINCERKPRTTYLFLHRATCFTITGIPARGKVWTKDYIKVCSISKEELEMWARREVGGKLHSCRLCNP